ncbi:hypothetical protein SAMN04488498_11188 [Mesorhizobium albiziae]|uniref:Beta/Gamma crystallin n=1 Tax=Neomesorhizobium albiziae TaxID=335020 RepID=A0A1I4BVW4_9HYPH|nr:hypothetical protein [Mesorhizobium albiziae]GLS29646.1 hypothetical protein GCM10007937_13540 [Mesorhizobium albiziae]SFK72307.1 hypothetical protein SAMN04488498_11188 [Mesorhizobium albiziae]
MRYVLATLTVVLGAAPALADAEPEEFRYVGDNHKWSLVCNSSGYQLKSQYPVARFVEAGVNSKVVEGIETLDLGKTCDALHNVLGKGKWCWANGGFRAEFENSSIGFPRQELTCPDPKDDKEGCGC